MAGYRVFEIPARGPPSTARVRAVVAGFLDPVPASATGRDPQP
jgi:hypothetical protein